MRTWTLAVSIFAHAAIVAAILVAPIFATEDLPEPRRPLTFETIVPLTTPEVPVALRSQPALPSTTTPSIPLDEPPDLPPDTTPPVATVPSDVVPHGAAGVPADVFPPPGDGVTAPPLPLPAKRDPVPVGGVIRPPTRIVYVEPMYPPIALAAGVQGTVILQAVIDEKGSVRELRVLRGHPLLDAAAMQAVAKWQFTPTLLNGTTVPVVMTVTVTFTLQR